MDKNRNWRFVIISRHSYSKYTQGVKTSQGSTILPTERKQHCERRRERCGGLHLSTSPEDSSVTEETPDCCSHPPFPYNAPPPPRIPPPLTPCVWLLSARRGRTRDWKKHTAMCVHYSIFKMCSWTVVKKLRWCVKYAQVSSPCHPPLQPVRSYEYIFLME